MILVDLNQIMIANLLQQLGKSFQVDENLIRHMILNSLRMYRVKFGNKYGELVICCDDKHYWRRDLYPYYKIGRKKARDRDSLDWNAIFKVLNGVRDDLKEHFPYKVLHVKHAEADDLIAAVVHKHGYLGPFAKGGVYDGVRHEQILILSSDKDFGQLQKYANVEQFSPNQKKYVRIPNPERFIYEHILRGDRGDGIPNFLSDDDTFVVGKRQKPITHKKLDKWYGLDLKDFCDEKMLRGYHRNRQLVDLDYIPDNIENEVIRQLENYKMNDRSKLFNYFVKNKLKGLMDVIQEF